MIHEILPVGMLQCNCSIFGDDETHGGLVIDPGDDPEEILELVRKHCLTVEAILITHAHIDHIGGAHKLKQATGAPVYMNANDEAVRAMLDEQAAWLGIRPPAPVEIDGAAREGDKLAIGAAEFYVLETPGHTPGSISLWIPSAGKLVAGDTLFRDSVGRTDLPGGSERQLLRSIQNKLLPLPEETVVIPGHGPNTTIGREKRFNPFLRGLA